MTNKTVLEIIYKNLVNFKDLTQTVFNISGRDVHALNLGGAYHIVDHETDADIMTIHEDNYVETFDDAWLNEPYMCF